MAHTRPDRKRGGLPDVSGYFIVPRLMGPDFEPGQGHPQAIKALQQDAPHLFRGGQLVAAPEDNYPKATSPRPRPSLPECFHPPSPFPVEQTSSQPRQRYMGTCDRPKSVQSHPEAQSSAWSAPKGKDDNGFHRATWGSSQDLQRRVGRFCPNPSNQNPSSHVSANPQALGHQKPTSSHLPNVHQYFQDAYLEGPSQAALEYWPDATNTSTSDDDRRPIGIDNQTLNELRKFPIDHPMSPWGWPEDSTDEESRAERYDPALATKKARMSALKTGLTNHKAGNAWHPNQPHIRGSNTPNWAQTRDSSSSEEASLSNGGKTSQHSGLPGSGTGLYIQFVAGRGKPANYPEGPIEIDPIWPVDVLSRRELDMCNKCGHFFVLGGRNPHRCRF